MGSLIDENDRKRKNIEDLLSMELDNRRLPKNKLIIIFKIN
jgi:hypothetical protein